MALINCKECGKEISDKALSCPHCGFPVQEEKRIKEKAKRAKKASKAGIIIWLIICIILCSLIALFNIFSGTLVLNMEELPYLLRFDIFNINITINYMSIFAIILSINYLLLLIKTDRSNFMNLLITNTFILFYNIYCIVIDGYFLEPFFYILCVIGNSVITLIVVLKTIKKTKYKLLKMLLLPLIPTIPFLVYLVAHKTYPLSYFYTDEEIRIMEEEKNKTPRQKVIDFLKESDVYFINNCNTDICKFTDYNENTDPIYYTIDFNEGSITSKSLDNQVTAVYNYKKNTGYANITSTSNWYINVYITFDEINNKYTYTYDSDVSYLIDINGVVETLTDTTVGLRELLIILCGGASIDRSEIIYEDSYTYDTI